MPPREVYLLPELHPPICPGAGLQLCARWFNSPQGEPSGVCTGHKNPHVSGRSFRTVVVFLSPRAKLGEVDIDRLKKTGCLLHRVAPSKEHKPLVNTTRTGNYSGGLVEHD